MLMMLPATVSRVIGKTDAAQRHSANPAKLASWQATGYKLSHKPLDLWRVRRRRGLTSSDSVIRPLQQILPQLLGGVGKTHTVDHLIPLSLGGSNSIRNLWPQSTKTSPWNSYVEDALERKLHKVICAGELDLKTAQREIASNWIEAYKNMFVAALSLQ